LSFLQCARNISLNEIFLTLLLYSFQRTIFLLLRECLVLSKLTSTA